MQVEMTTYEYTGCLWNQRCSGTGADLYTHLRSHTQAGVHAAEFGMKAYHMCRLRSLTILCEMYALT